MKESGAPLQPPEPLDPQIAVLIDAYLSKQITRREFDEAISLLRQGTGIDKKGEPERPKYSTDG
jgi:hypothetical protein